MEKRFQVILILLGVMMFTFVAIVGISGKIEDDREREKHIMKQEERLSDLINRVNIIEQKQKEKD